MLYVGIYRIALDLSRKAEEKHKKTASIVAQRALSQMDSAGGGSAASGGRDAPPTAADAAAAVLQQQVAQQHFSHYGKQQHTPVSGRPSAANTVKDDDDPTSSGSPEPGPSTLEAPTTSSGSRSPKTQADQWGHQRPEAQQPLQHTVLVEPEVELHHQRILESSPTPTKTTALQRSAHELELDFARSSSPAGEQLHPTLGAATSSPNDVSCCMSQPPRGDCLQSPSRQLSVPSASGGHQRPANASALESGVYRSFDRSLQCSALCSHVSQPSFEAVGLWGIRLVQMCRLD